LVKLSLVKGRLIKARLIKGLIKGKLIRGGLLKGLIKGRRHGRGLHICLTLFKLGIFEVCTVIVTHKYLF
jgi:hypothetical protein